MSFKQYLKEQKESTALPTKLAGFKQDYIINKMGREFECFNSDGDFKTIKKGDQLYAELAMIFKQSDEIEWDEYKEEYAEKHKKLYDKNDWDADYVIVDVKDKAFTQKILDKLKV